MTKKKSRAELVFDSVELELELELVKVELKTSNDKLNEIDSYIRDLVHKGWSLRRDMSIIIVKKIISITRPELKDVLG